MTVGFTLGGSGTSGVTEVLARAAGPALAQFNVQGALTDPVLRLFQLGRVLVANDDWGGDAAVTAAAASVGAFPFLAGSKDSALLISLPSAAYSAEVVDAGGGTGMSVVELYDTRPDPPDRGRPRLINISARGLTGGEGAPLTAGFTIQGGANVTILLRGVGPALERLGVTGVVADPALALFRGPTLVSSNQNWHDVAPVAIEGARAAVGAFALEANSLDAALLIQLGPGSYTAQVSNPSGTGIALIEVYEVP
jgi:hypothetical protein